MNAPNFISQETLDAIQLVRRHSSGYFSIPSIGLTAEAVADLFSLDARALEYATANTPRSEDEENDDEDEASSTDSAGFPDGYIYEGGANIEIADMRQTVSGALDVHIPEVHSGFAFSTYRAWEVKDNHLVTRRVIRVFLNKHTYDLVRLHFPHLKVPSGEAQPRHKPAVYEIPKGTPASAVIVERWIEVTEKAHHKMCVRVLDWINRTEIHNAHVLRMSQARIEQATAFQTVLQDRVGNAPPELREALDNRHAKRTYRPDGSVRPMPKGE